MDLRLPIGYIFSLYGVMLAVYGFFTNKDPMYAKSLDININIGWGIVMLVFGLLMLLFAKLGKNKGA